MARRGRGVVEEGLASGGRGRAPCGHGSGPAAAGGNRASGSRACGSSGDPPVSNGALKIRMRASRTAPRLARVQLAWRAQRVLSWLFLWVHARTQAEGGGVRGCAWMACSCRRVHSWLLYKALLCTTAELHVSRALISRKHSLEHLRLKVPPVLREGLPSGRQW